MDNNCGKPQVNDMSMLDLPYLNQFNVYKQQSKCIVTLTNCFISVFMYI